MNSQRRLAPGAEPPLQRPAPLRQRRNILILRPPRTGRIGPAQLCFQALELSQPGRRKLRGRLLERRAFPDVVRVRADEAGLGRFLGVNHGSPPPISDDGESLPELAAVRVLFFCRDVAGRCTADGSSRCSRLTCRPTSHRPPFHMRCRRRRRRSRPPPSKGGPLATFGRRVGWSSANSAIRL